MQINNKDILLLDTHVWIWLLNKNEELKNSQSLACIKYAAKYANLRLSVISLWEVAMLETKGRINLGMDCLDWIKLALTAPSISLLELTPEIAVLSTRLPADFHGDPADRIIVASARKSGAYIVTKDSKIVEYGKEKFVNIIQV